MGKATRWLKGIFGIKTSNNNENGENANKKLYSGDRRRYTPPTPPTAEAAATEAAWLKSYYGESEKEQSKHAIAVAAATAAAADAAVAAAQAAVAVVRLTSRGSVFSGGGGGGGGGGMVVELAAMKIQATFRGYLARKALRALKGLVKIQALVRGYLVRKQASATFHCMQALIRAQATVRNKRSLSRIPTQTQTQTQSQIQTATTTHDFYNYPRSEIRARRSVDNLDDTRSEHAASPSVHSRRLSASFERRTIKPITEDTPKIVEMDPGRPRTPSRTYKTSTRHVLSSDTCERDPAYPTPLSIPSCQHWHDTEWGLTGDECRFSTAHSTPRVMHTAGLLNPAPVTPTRSVCGDGRYSNYSRGDNYNQFPNYMANTKSFCSKVRSQSAPKQRPENGFLVKKKMSLNEMMESRNSLSGVRMQRSCSQVQGAINFKNAVMGKLERSYDFTKDSHVYHLPSK